MDEVTLATGLQWGLLAGNVGLLLAALIVGARRRPARPWAFAVGMLAATHAVYYALFLMRNHVQLLDAEQTMLFSISLRYMVLFLASFLLLMALRRWPWTR